MKQKDEGNETWLDPGSAEQQPGISRDQDLGTLKNGFSSG
jgi:hypothetical protein